MTVFSDVSVLIPWRAGDPQREGVWNYIRNQWFELSSVLGFEIVVGQPDDMEGPFNCASALNNAWRRATRPNVVMFGADCLPDVTAISEAMWRIDRGELWVPLFKDTQYYGQYSTHRIINGDDSLYHLPDPNLYVPFQTGVLALTHQAYYQAGGHDDRFVGWGAEDSAFRISLYRLFGDSEPVDRSLYCLWHETGHRSMNQNNWDLIKEYEKIQTREEMVDYIECERPNRLLDVRYE